MKKLHSYRKPAPSSILLRQGGSRGLRTSDLRLLLAVLCSHRQGNAVSKEIFKLHFLCLQVPVFQY